MLRRIAWLSFLAVTPFQLLAQPQSTVPASELVQYIRDARKAGLSDPQIRQNATSAGWPETAVGDAIAAVVETPKAGPNPPKVISQPKPESAPPTPSFEVTQPVRADHLALAESKPGTPPTSQPGNSDAAPMGGPPVGDRKPALNHGVPDDYEIGAGDILQINVWKEPEASIPSVVVRPDGKISMPLLKDVPVVGLTPKQAEQLITEQLSRFINGADVTVVVTGINSKKVYLVGAVKKEGPLAYTYRMSVMQALSEAGGLTDYAKRKKIYVLRNEKGRQFRLPFDYDAVLKGERMELNISLLPGDTVVVPH
jgi:polysaccharide biosynthesis/export protein